MESREKNREWVKNAAIVFLAVLLVLTFFSNTWRNRSLPEVATQSVSDGSITAKVRGTGTVTANGNHQVKAPQTRVIRAVMVKSGQEVNTGDVLFVLGEGESEEIEAAQEALRTLQVSYQRAAAGFPSYSYKLDELEIASAKKALDEAEKTLKAVKNKSKRDLPYEQEAAAQQELESAKQAVSDAEKAVATQQIIADTYQDSYDTQATAAQGAAAARVQELQSELNQLELDYTAQQAMSPEEQQSIPEDERVTKEKLDAARAALQEAQDQLNGGGYLPPRTALDEQLQKLEEAKAALEEAKAAQASAQQKLDAIQAVIDEIVGTDVISQEYKQAKAARDEAEKTYLTLKYNLEQKKVSDQKSQALSAIDLSDLNQQIELARQKLNDLSGGEDNQITANVSGIVQSIECSAGDHAIKDDVLCTIEVPDMGHTLSFSVTNEQARRLRVGDKGTVSNYYWGNQVTATLNSIQVDPKSPQNNKLLTFDIDGDVNTGAELSVSVGQKSANYDLILPNSAIRSDSNGKFVLVVDSKNSPLGNRYVARRVEVEVLAEDDTNSAVSAELERGDHVITTSSAPVKHGDLVRLADS